MAVWLSRAVNISWGAAVTGLFPRSNFPLFQEQLFVSKKSVFDGRKPIRGGIPFIFPQFGTWHYGTNGPPYNGFGRIARWQLDKVGTCE